MIALKQILIATDVGEPADAVLSDAERVVRTAPCPVLTVRHPEHEFVTPDALVAVARS
jgi:hypothetical protein